MLALLLCSATLNIAFERQTDNAKHVIFFGDSLMRYQYLAFVYKLHFRTGVVPSVIINEKLHSSWLAFFQVTTEVFNKSMTCDCFREGSVSQLATSRENRRYEHPSGRIVVSYFSWMGYHPIQGMNATAVSETSGKKITQPDWQYSTPHSFTQHHLTALNPSPSVIFVNSGHWRHKPVAKNPRLLLNMLQDVVLSQPFGVSDPTAAARQHLLVSDDIILGKCVAWLATTTPNIPWWTGARDADWAILKGHICRKSLSHPVSSDPAMKESQYLKTCVYIPFKFSVNSSDYFDHMHFSNENIYHARTDRAFEACGLDSSDFYSL